MRRARAGACRKADARRKPRGRGGARLAVRPAGRHQGSRRCRRGAHDLWLADLPPPRADDLAPGGGADRAQGRHRHRQVEHAGIRRRRLDLQRGVRPHPQSVEHGADLGRLDRRRCRRARCRRDMARTRLRPWRKPASPRHLLLGRRLAAVARPGHARYLQQSVLAALGPGADGTHRRRCGAVSRRHGGPVPARSSDLRGAASIVRRRRAASRSWARSSRRPRPISATSSRRFSPCGRSISWSIGS